LLQKVFSFAAAVEKFPAIGARENGGKYVQYKNFPNACFSFAVKLVHGEK